MRNSLATSLLLLGLAATPEASSADRSEVTLTAGPDMNIARMNHFTVLLPDGRVAVLGGHGQGFAALASLEVWSPASSAFTSLNLSYPLDSGALVRLADGRYLAAGGAGDLGNAGHKNAQIYDPDSTTITTLSSTLKYRRSNSNGALLGNGKVLIVGGWYDTSSATYGEVFDPASGLFSTTGPLNTPRSLPAALPTADGKIVVAGGTGPFGNPPVVDQVELYDPDTNGFSVLASALFGGETGWAFYGITGQGVEAWRLTGGQYRLLVSRTVSQSTEWAIACFDPVSRRFAKLAVQPAFPSRINVIPGTLDRVAQVMYLMGGTNSNSAANFTFHVYGLDVLTGQRVLESDALTIADYYPGNCGMVRLQDGRILVTGGTTRVDSKYNFNPVSHSFFLSGLPSPVALRIRAAQPGPIVSWPATAPNYSLLSAPEVSSAAWQVVTNPPSVVGNELTVQVDASPSRRFFRLQDTGGTNVIPVPTQISVRPSAATCKPGSQMTFVATVTGASNSGVAWSVEEGTTGGSIDSQGRYTAPSDPGLFTIVATSGSDPAKRATALVYITEEAATSDYYPRPVVPGETTYESKSLTTSAGSPASLVLSDGTRVDIPPLPTPISVTLTRTNSTVDLGGALQQASGSMRVVTYSGDFNQLELVPTITFPAKEAGSLKTVNIARIGDVTLGLDRLTDQTLFLPVAYDASENLSTRDIFLRTSIPSATPAGIRAQGEAPGSATVTYNVSTYQGNLNWARKPQLLRMIPGAAERTPLRQLPPATQAEILRRPIRNVVLLVHGHNEAEGIGFTRPDIGSPWYFAYKRDVWHHLYLEFQAKYPEYLNCTAFYEYIYPTFRPIFGGAESLGNDFAQQVAEDPQLKALKQKYNLFVVAHSMGGLVARVGLNLMGESITNNFEKLLTWGSPHRGSPMVTLRYLLTSGYNLNFTGLCGVIPPLEALNLFSAYRNRIQGLAIDTPGERELRWDNYRLLNLEGLGWRRRYVQTDDINSDPTLYNFNLRIFNLQDKFLMSDKYAAFYGITSQPLLMNFTCHGLALFNDAAPIAQGNALTKWIYNTTNVLNNYEPNSPPLHDGDGAVPVDSAAGLGIIPAANATYRGDVDHEQFYERDGRLSSAATFEVLKLREAANKVCDCPNLALTQVQPADPTVQITGALSWPGDLRPGQRLLTLSALKNPGRSTAAAQSFAVQDDGSFRALFALTDLVPATGETVYLQAQMKDGSELTEPAGRIFPKFSITPAEVTLRAGETVVFNLDTGLDLTPGEQELVVWSLTGPGTLVANHYTAPPTVGTATVAVVFSPYPYTKATATVRVTDGLVKVQTFYAASSPLLCTDDFLIVASLVSKLQSQADPVSQYLWSQLYERIRTLIAAPSTPPEQLRVALALHLNTILKAGALYDPARFAGVKLSTETLARLSQNPQGDDLIRLNRMLLEDAYPLEIARKDFGSRQLRNEYTQWSISGSKEGSERVWYENGQLSSEQTWHNGALISVRNWFENGCLKSVGEFGATTHWISYWTNDTGNTGKEDESYSDPSEAPWPTRALDYYNPTGELQSESVYQKIGKNQYNVATSYYYRNGQKSAEGTIYMFDYFRSGWRTGAWTTWYENGQKQDFGTYASDMKDGAWTTWTSEGIKSSEGSYARDLKQGAWIFYYDTGEKRLTGSYTNGTETGVWTEWNKDGTVRDTWGG